MRTPVSKSLLLSYASASVCSNDLKVFFRFERMCCSERKGKAIGAICFWVLFWILSVCVLLRTILVPTSSVVTVVDLQWTREQDIEQFSELQQEAWEWHVPLDAYDQRSRMRLDLFQSTPVFHHERWTSYKVKRWHVCETLRTTGHDHPQQPQQPQTPDTIEFDSTPVLGHRRLGSTRVFHEVALRAPGHAIFWYGIEPGLSSSIFKGDKGLCSESAFGFFKDVLFEHDHEATQNWPSG